MRIAQGASLQNSDEDFDMISMVKTVIIFFQLLMTMKMMVVVVNKENADVMESTQLCILLSKDCAAKFVQWGGMESDLCACKAFLQRMFAKRVCTSFAQKFGENEARKPSGRFLPWPKITVGPNPGREKRSKCSLWTFALSTFVCHDNSSAGGEDP